MKQLLALTCALILTVACSDDDAAVEVDSGPAVDASRTDAGAGRDADAPDTGPNDAEPPPGDDAGIDGSVDAGARDAGADDASTDDASTDDASTDDASTDDATTDDAGDDDAGDDDAGDDSGTDAGTCTGVERPSCGFRVLDGPMFSCGLSALPPPETPMVYEQSPGVWCLDTCTPFGDTARCCDYNTGHLVECSYASGTCDVCQQVLACEPVCIEAD